MATHRSGHPIADGRKRRLRPTSTYMASGWNGCGAVAQMTSLSHHWAARFGGDPAWPVVTSGYSGPKFALCWTSTRSASVNRMHVAQPLFPQPILSPQTRSGDKLTTKGLVGDNQQQIGQQGRYGTHAGNPSYGVVVINGLYRSQDSGKSLSTTARCRQPGSCRTLSTWHAQCV